MIRVASMSSTISRGRAPASQARSLAFALAVRIASSSAASIDLITRWAVLWEATAPKSCSWPASTPRSETQSRRRRSRRRGRAAGGRDRGPSAARGSATSPPTAPRSSRCGQPVRSTDTPRRGRRALRRPPGLLRFVLLFLASPSGCPPGSEIGTSAIRILKAQEDVPGCLLQALIGESGLAPLNAYNPISFPRISFMSGEHGTGGHAGSPEGKDSPQMSLLTGRR